MVESTSSQNTTTRAGSRHIRAIPRCRLLASTASGVTRLSLAGSLESADSVIGASEDDDEPVTVGLLAPKPDSNYTYFLRVGQLCFPGHAYAYTNQKFDF